MYPVSPGSIKVLRPSSHRAARAQSSGVFEQEIVPVSTRIIDEDGTERELTVAKDDGIRAGTTLSGLNKLRAAFKPDGSTTAGPSHTHTHTPSHTPSHTSSHTFKSLCDFISVHYKPFLHSEGALGLV